MTNLKQSIERELSKVQRFAATIEHHAANGTLLDMILPNGKRLGDCTGEEVGEIGARMTEISKLLGSQDQKPRVRVKALSRAA
ncbi:hypothetical protein M2360_003684 [Rhizobium sp. SG_E_25_P2]|uniref:hypothetical protein n=1 Tax=Rhizobium sp. SG_E_25_P2 TaxID=2879942 RepID=UPI002473FC1C|nr:hypothetical protein [Rhizobium sp. SG_E_25_P2]MDH6268279.1 hypothetical protein [Rhizobium sp. SG_E_25_P2]